MHDRRMRSRIPRGGVARISVKNKTIDTTRRSFAILRTAAFYLWRNEMKRIKRGEIYYADLHPVVGSEQDGARPVLCIQSNAGNKHSPTTIVAAITSSKTKTHLPTHVQIDSNGLKVKSTVLLEQIRTIDKTRLEKYVGKLSKNDMRKVDHAILVSLGIKAMEEPLR